MKKVIASAGLIALGAAAGAVAQTTGDQKPWSISGQLRGFYDDNINTAPEGPSRVDSFGFEVSPSGSLNWSSGPDSIMGSYTYWNRYYFERRNTDQSHDFELSANHNFSARYSLGVTESFVIAQEPEVLAGTGPVTTPLRSNGNNIHNGVGLNFQAQLTRLFGLVLGYNNGIYSYDENAFNTVTPGQPSRSALLNTVSHTFTIDSTWTLDEKTRAVFGYKFQALYYTSAESVENELGAPPLYANYPYGGPFYVPADSRNSYSHYVYVGLDHSFSQDLGFTGRVGIQYLDYYEAGTQDVFGNFDRSATSSLSPYADLSLHWTYGDGDVLTVGFQHEHNETDQAANADDPGAGVTLDEQSSVVYVTATQKLTPITPNLVLTGSLQYQNSQFNGGPVNEETDNFFLFGLDLSYLITPHFSTDLGYNYDLLASDISGRGYDRNQVYVGVTATY
jgi:Putative beta-barrel porin 2